MRKLLLALAVLTMLFLSALTLSASASSPYYIEVDITNQIVTVYRNGDTSQSGIVRQMVCSTGKSSTPTPRGTFTMPKKSRSSERTEWYRFSNCWGKYATRIHGSYLFHSYLFSKKATPA